MDNAQKHNIYINLCMAVNIGLLSVYLISQIFPAPRRIVNINKTCKVLLWDTWEGLRMSSCTLGLAIGIAAHVNWVRCHHVTTRSQVADGDMEGSCEYTE
jgi:hypothetical protein